MTAITDNKPAQTANDPPAKKPPLKKDCIIENLNSHEKQTFEQYDKRFSALKNEAGKAMAIAIVFFVPSVVLLLTSGLCMTLTGVNVIHDVTFNLLLPAIVGLALSIPLFYQSYYPSNLKRNVRLTWLNHAVQIINEKLIRPPDVTIKAFVNEATRFVQFNLVPKGNQVYQLEFLRELKEKYPKEKEDVPTKRIKKIVDIVTANIARFKKPEQGEALVKDVTVSK